MLKQIIISFLMIFQGINLDAQNPTAQKFKDKGLVIITMGTAWLSAANYFKSAWETVLGRLKFSIERGPVDWKNPPSGDLIRLD